MPIKKFLGCLQQKLNTSYQSQYECVNELLYYPQHIAFCIKGEKKIQNFSMREHAGLPTPGTSPSHPSLAPLFCHLGKTIFYHYTTAFMTHHLSHLITLPFCSTDETVCQTIHMFNTQTSVSLSVEKTCMKPSLCTANHIGCTTSDDGKTKVRI